MLKFRKGDLRRHNTCSRHRFLVMCVVKGSNCGLNTDSTSSCISAAAILYKHQTVRSADQTSLLSRLILKCSCFILSIFSISPSQPILVDGELNFRFIAHLRFDVSVDSTVGMLLYRQTNAKFDFAVDTAIASLGHRHFENFQEKRSAGAVV
jgi:hypothetical protein